MKAVDPNACLIRTVPAIPRVYATSARTHVLELVASTPSALSPIMYQFALAKLVTPETLSDIAALLLKVFISFFQKIWWVIVFVSEPPKDPCNPSPCGLNTVCRTTGKSAICECLPGFFGNPSLGGCRPECTISSDCPRDKACVNTKCVDPCPGVCGFKAVCNVINHSPVCSCPQPLVGDPFSLCTEPVSASTFILICSLNIKTFRLSQLTLATRHRVDQTVNVEL